MSYPCLRVFFSSWCRILPSNCIKRIVNMYTVYSNRQNTPKKYPVFSKKRRVFYGILMNILVCGNYVNYYVWSSYILNKGLEIMDMHV